jgi:hypothetical protein
VSWFPARAAAAWARFWFRPEPAATLALLRIAIGSVTLIWGLALIPDLDTFEGAHGLAGGFAGATPLDACVIIFAAGLVAGYHSRLCAAGAFACLAWFHHVDPWALNSGDALLRDVLFLLALAPAGATCSVDAIRRRAPDRVLVSPWALRLVQAQVSVMYIAAVAQKLAGAPWRDGTAVSYPLRIPSITRVPLPHWLTDSPLAAHLLTWGVISAEAAIGILVWNRRARPYVLGAGVILHLGIEVTLRAGLFSWVVLATYVAFVPPARAERVIAAARNRLHSPRENAIGSATKYDPMGMEGA